MNCWVHDFWRTAAVALICLCAVGLAQTPAPKTRRFECRSNGCCDQHEWCKFWASIGECQSNRVWMAPNCQLICRTCPNGNPSASNATSAADRRPPPQNRAQQCEQIRQNPANAQQETLQRGLVVPREDTSRRRTLSVGDVSSSNGQFGCVPQLDFADCRPNVCYHLRYRSLDGTCNNFARPNFGAAFTPYRRTIPAAYANGMSSPVGAQTRPSARESTRLLLASTQQVTNSTISAMVMQWGQFLSHDIAKTTLLPNGQCRSCADVPGRCFNIKTLPSDQRFGQFGCLRVSRSSPVCGSGQSEPREQLNENTAYIDASMVYGSSAQDLTRFREGQSGNLRTSLFNEHVFMPFDQRSCNGPGACNANFQAGDNRANIFLGLSSMHTILVREHNRVASMLQRLNPQWSGDQLFQEARKVVGAEVQVITFKEYLPKVLGRAADDLLGKYAGYDASVDATVSNVFTTAAFRFGHGMIQEFYNRIDAQGNTIAQGGLRFDDAVFKSNKLLFEGGVDPVLRGLMTTPAKRPQRLTPAVTERLFGSTDLASINIQRGRDHGLPSYAAWRRFCRLGETRSFDDLSAQILDANVRRNLQQTYGSVDQIDLFVGAMLEDPIVEGLVGPTLACLLADQFKRLRDGDRFWFENAGIFSTAQVAELRKASLSRLLCDNSNVGVVPADAMNLARSGNLLPCDQVAQLDLRHWRQTS